jgi:hypothetical protein
VSLDGGKLWRQAEITRFETPNPGGKLWCWVFWRFEVRHVIVVRRVKQLFACTI